MVGVRSFDQARDREAPKVLEGHWLNGESARLDLDTVTLIVAVKANCDGCREFMNFDLEGLDGLDVVVISATALDSEEWSTSVRPVLVSPSAFDDLDVRWPPFYVLIDPVSRRVLTEGVVFSPQQVATEIKRFRQP